MSWMSAIVSFSILGGAVLDGAWMELGWSLVFPQEANTLPLPAPARVGREDRERLSPMREAAGQDQEEEARTMIEWWTLDRARKDNAWLAPQGIFEDPLAFGAGAVGEGVEDEGGPRARS